MLKMRMRHGYTWYTLQERVQLKWTPSDHRIRGETFFCTSMMIVAIVTIGDVLKSKSKPNQYHLFNITSRIR